MSLPARVRIVEVGARDGLQNEPEPVPVSVRIELIRMLADAGLTTIEAAAFVSPKWIPQMAGASEVLAGLGKRSSVSYPVLVPNLKGLEAALAAGAEEIAVFGAASETFSQKNINCSIAESLERFAPVVEIANRQGVRVRGYVSCVAGCPYEGEVAADAPAAIAKSLYEMGCAEISLGDTTGVGTERKIREVIEAVTRHVPVERVAGHYHDTYGRALDNVVVSLEMGVAVFDSSVAGLGGCPYAPGAAGNLATEVLVDKLDRLGIETGIDPEALGRAGRLICEHLGRNYPFRERRP